MEAKLSTLKVFVVKLAMVGVEMFLFQLIIYVYWLGRNAFCEGLYSHKGYEYCAVQ